MGRRKRWTGKSEWKGKEKRWKEREGGGDKPMVRWESVNECELGKGEINSDGLGRIDKK